MNPSADTELLFLLLRSGLHTKHRTTRERLRTLCAEHGPTGRSSTGSPPVRHAGHRGTEWSGSSGKRPSPEHQPSRTQKIRWAVNVERIEQTYARQWAAACELGGAVRRRRHPDGRPEGLAAAVRYPVPEHRPCGDLTASCRAPTRRATGSPNNSAPVGTDF